MKEYIVKLTQTEAEALTYMVGGMTENTPIFNYKMFKQFENTVFLDNNIRYNHHIRCNRSTLKYYGT
jgi:hypothetical protein